MRASATRSGAQRSGSFVWVRRPRAVSSTRGQFSATHSRHSGYAASGAPQYRATAKISEGCRCSRGRRSISADQIRIGGDAARPLDLARRGLGQLDRGPGVPGGRLVHVAILLPCRSGERTRPGLKLNREEDDLPPIQEESWSTPPRRPTRSGARSSTPTSTGCLREAATERAWTGELLDESRAGLYTCGACGAELFKSGTKFDSGCGWPSFYDSVNPDAVELIEDRSLGVIRTEVRCANCGSHLGHVFDDGFGTPTGLRYCMNSLALGFSADEK